MDNQVISHSLWIERLLILAAFIIIAVSVTILGFYWDKKPNPYVHEVLSLQGDSVQGEAIFEINCSACHGIKANGSVGPSLKNVPKRKSKRDLINQVISGNTPPMPKFQPSPQEMADLLVYLEQL